MSFVSLRARLILTTVFSSIIVAVLCGTLAVYLNRQQIMTADILGEDIGSRRAASNLEETLADLLALHRQGLLSVGPLHSRAEEHLAVIEELANKDEERELANKVADSLRVYRQLWDRFSHGEGDVEAVISQLERDTIPACHALQRYNARQIETSEQAHRQSIRHMTWGAAIVGALGSVGGLILGFGLTRSLQHTFHQLTVRVQGASELLSQELPVYWERGRNVSLHDQMQELVQQIEQVVEKLQRREREARRAERLAAVGQLAAGVAHEIRNSLTSVKLLVQAALNDPEAGALSTEDLRLIEEEIRRIERSLQTFLEFARPPRLDPAPCDPADLIRGALTLVRARVEEQHVEVRIDAPPEPLVIDADGEQLRQVFVNLILNALDAMPRGGTLSVGVGLVGEMAELVVEDTGPGLAPDILPRLFQPFATNKVTGVGLGLVVSRRIVEDHGGTLSGENRSGGGARFVVSVPRHAAQQAAHSGSLDRAQDDGE